MSSAYYELHDTLLKVEGVHLDLGGRPILRDVNIELKDIVRPGLKQGQVVGLLGPSGMGKTQLFRILSGLNIPDRGTVKLKEGKPVTPGSVGVVAQSYPLLNHRTLAGNMAVAGKQTGLSGAALEEKVKKLLSRFGLEGQEEKYPAQLSGGQRQRAAIAQQFMCSEWLLLMDEPFSGLDPIALDAVCDFIAEISIQSEDSTLIVVTHDIAAAMRVCDSLWLLGRERDGSGKPIAGANIRHVVNLIDADLAWKKGIENTPEFFEKLKEVKQLFESL